MADFDAIYKHLKHYYIRRILNSDVHSGTYVMVVAEGVKGEDGKYFSDSGDSTDSFGHVRLAGAGRYIRTRLEAMMREDPQIRQFMKVSGMYVPGVFEIPEIREVIPGHIVRSGSTSSYDVNFGKQIGASAVILLDEGISGVTVVEVYRGRIRSMPTADAIVPRPVSLEAVTFYEQMDVCFGRTPQHYEPMIEEQQGEVERFL